MSTSLTTDLKTETTLDLRGKTITTFILYEVRRDLQPRAIGDRIEVLTDAFPAIEPDVAAWCRSSGNQLVDAEVDGDSQRFIIERGPELESDHKLALIVSDDGLFELLSPLGFALGSALEGDEVSIYFLGPAVRILSKGYVARAHGWMRPISRFPRAGLTKAGHIEPQEKVAQLRELGARIFVCGPSMAHYKVDVADLAFEDVTVCEYLTFMEQMHDADMHMFV